MNTNLKNYILSFIAIFALILFIILYGIALFQSWFSKDMPVFGEPFQYVATILCGLVGGFTAKGLGVQISDDTIRTQADDSPKNRIIDRLKNLGASLFPAFSDDAILKIGAAYGIIYTLFGCTAILTWVLKEPTTAEMIKNLGMIFLGLLVPSVSSFLIPPKPNNQPPG